MERIPVRQLNQETAEVLARVERGETLGVTNRGRLVAKIVPVTGSELDDLIEAGIVVPPTATGPFPPPVTVPGDATEAGALLEQLRDEERW